MISRRWIQSVLGAIWLLDGIFQLKPKMFTNSFLKDVILPTGQGQPHWISAMVQLGVNVVGGHIALWNAAFALVQIALGLALLLNFKVKSTIVASIVWSLIVWVFGEGFGQILTGQAILLNGAPGAALVYGVIGAALWPAEGDRSSEWNQRGIRVGQIGLALLLLLGVILQLQPAYLSASGLSQAVAVSWAAKSIAHMGFVVTIVLAVIEFVLAFLLIMKIQLRLASVAAIVLSLLFWWVGQSFGQLNDPLATDFNTGLLLALLAVCAFPYSFGNRSQDTLDKKRGVLV